MSVKKSLSDVAQPTLDARLERGVAAHLYDSNSMVYDFVSGFRVYSLGFRVSGFGFRIQN